MGFRRKRQLLNYSVARNIWFGDLYYLPSGVSVFFKDLVESIVYEEYN